MVQQLLHGSNSSVLVMGIVLTVYGLAMAIDEWTHPARNRPMVAAWLLMAVPTAFYPLAQTRGFAVVAVILRVLSMVGAIGVLLIVMVKLCALARRAPKQDKGA